jgi:CheY-like chemotaxis protein
VAITKNFLIVDDDDDDREMFCEALQEVNPDCQCYTAQNGRRAITALEDGEIDKPDLIFLDINMPVMNGWQCLSKLKESETYKAIPVIMYSTSSYPEDVKSAQRLGALCFFSKPSRFTELKNILSLVVDHMGKASLASLVEGSSMFLTGSDE